MLLLRKEYIYMMQFTINWYLLPLVICVHLQSDRARQVSGIKLLSALSMLRISINFPILRATRNPGYRIRKFRNPTILQIPD